MDDRIQKRIELKAPVSRVWQALTDHREFGAWFRVALEGPFVPGVGGRGRIHAGLGAEHLTMTATVQRMVRTALFLHMAPLRHRPPSTIRGAALR